MALQEEHFALDARDLIALGEHVERLVKAMGSGTPPGSSMTSEVEINGIDTRLILRHARTEAGERDVAWVDLIRETHIDEVADLVASEGVTIDSGSIRIGGGGGSTTIDADGIIEVVGGSSREAIRKMATGEQKWDPSAAVDLVTEIARLHAVDVTRRSLERLERLHGPGPYSQAVVQAALFR